MKSTLPFLFIHLVLFGAASSYANESVSEVIEVLAPKQKLSLSANNQTTSSLDDRFNFHLDRTIADQLSTLSGVSLNGQGGQFQSYAIRGFSRARIRTEIDGIPIITDRRAGNSASFIAPELFSLGQVIKGPSAVLYGSQALGGVVSLTTAMPDGTEVGVSGQSSNQGLNLSLKHQQNNLTTAFTYQQANNDETPEHNELNTQFERYSGLLKYQFENDGLTTTFSWLPSYGKDIGKSNVKYPHKEISDYPEELHSLTQVQVNAGSDWSAKLFHHYQNWDSSTLRVEQYQALTQYQSHTIGAQWLQKLPLQNLNSYWGVDWLSRDGVKITSDYELFSDNEQISDNLLSNEVAGSEDNLAIFNKNQWAWGKLSFDLGLRYDWLKQQGLDSSNSYDSKLNASLFMSMPITEKFKVALDVGNGFRYPTLSERYFNGRTPRGFIVGNQDLKPETSIGSQLSFTWSTSDNININTAFYHYDLDNYIERYEVNDDLLSYRNLEQANIYGFETELRWYFSEQIEHHFNFQQQKGQDQHNHPLADLHPRKFNWTLLFELDNWSVANSLSHYLKAYEVNDSEATRESFTLWNLSISHQLSDNQTISLTISNVTNKEYYASLDEDATLQPKRGFKLSMNWQF